MFEAVEYEASENVTPCSGCFNKWCFSVWNLRRPNDGRRDINNVCRRTTFSRECIPVGCVPPASVAISGVGGAQWGCVRRGCVQGCVSRGRAVSGGVSAQTGVHPHYMLGYTPPPWTEWMTDRFKNINFPQLRLWAVKIISREKRELVCYCATHWWEQFLRSGQVNSGSSPRTESIRNAVSRRLWQKTF